MTHHTPKTTRFPYTTLFRSEKEMLSEKEMEQALARITYTTDLLEAIQDADFILESIPEVLEQKLDTYEIIESAISEKTIISDRKSTRLNSSHVAISYAVFCL